MLSGTSHKVSCSFNHVSNRGYLMAKLYVENFYFFKTCIIYTTLMGFSLLYIGLQNVSHKPISAPRKQRNVKDTC